MQSTISPRPGFRPGAPAGVRPALTAYQNRRTGVNVRPLPAHPVNLSPSRLPQTESDVALWGGFLRLLATNGHSYGGGYWGGN